MMKLNPAGLLFIILLCWIVGSFSSSAQTGVVTIVVPFTPGTIPDYLSRVLAQQLKDQLGFPVITDNRLGASGNLGTFRVARSNPDGNTLLMTTASHVSTNIVPFRKFNFDPRKSFEPIILIAKSRLVLAVSNNTPAKTLAEYIALGRSKAASLNYSSPGLMSVQHLLMGLFKQKTKTNAVHVSYPGSAGVIEDLIAGRVNAMFVPIDSALPLLAAGDIRPLAVASPERLPQAKDIPTLQELGLSGLDVPLWFGLLAPAGTSKAIVTRSNKLTNDDFARPQSTADFAKRGLELVGGPLQVFRDFIADQTRLWSEVISSSQLKPE